MLLLYSPQASNKSLTATERTGSKCIMLWWMPNCSRMLLSIVEQRKCRILRQKHSVRGGGVYFGVVG